MTPEDEEFYLRAGQVFTASAPIRQRDLFAGRMEQGIAERLIDAETAERLLS